MTQLLLKFALPVCTAALFCTACGGPARPFELHRVASDEFGGGDGALSPDGNSLVLASHRTGSWDLWRFDIRQDQWSRLTDDPADELEAQWSPDGTRLVYTATKFGNKDLFVLNLAGGTPLRLTTDPEDDEYPAWSPDGKSIVYTGGAWNRRDFFLISPRRRNAAQDHENAGQGRRLLVPTRWAPRDLPPFRLRHRQYLVDLVGRRLRNARHLRALLGLQAGNFTGR